MNNPFVEVIRFGRVVQTMGWIRFVVERRLNCSLVGAVQTSSTPLVAKNAPVKLGGVGTPTMTVKELVASFTGVPLSATMAEKKFVEFVWSRSGVHVITPLPFTAGWFVPVTVDRKSVV